MLDDPVLFGRIAVAHALSDVWAMGARPVTALNIAGYPAESLGPEVLHLVLSGAMEALNEAGVILLGGHTIREEELHYGLAVTGIVHPDAILHIGGARAGDSLFLSKALGSDTVAAALRRGGDRILRWVDAVALRDGMLAFNGAASQVARGAQCHACKDVSSWGLLGAAISMARASKCRFVIDADALPLLPGAMEAAEFGHCPRHHGETRRYFDGMLRREGSVSESLQELLFAPETSGGLLMAIPSSMAEEALEALVKVAPSTAVIGHVEEGEVEVLLRLGEGKEHASDEG